jgi:hypothetical protein
MEKRFRGKGIWRKELPGKRYMEKRFKVKGT